MSKKLELKLGRGTLALETDRMAKQAGGAVTVQLGETVVLATVCASKELQEHSYFLPLTVDYQEKTYAAGKIPGGYFKREGRPTAKEVLTSRLIDRPLRPLFPEGFVQEVQVTVLVLSSDGENNSDILGINGASAALMVSDVPLLEPVGAVRVGLIQGAWVLNPTFEELKSSSLDLIVASTASGPIMIEAGAHELDEEKMIEAIEFGYRHCLPIIDLQKKLAKEAGKQKSEYPLCQLQAQVLAKVEELTLPAFKELNHPRKKEERQEVIHKLAQEIAKKLVTDDSGITNEEVMQALEEIEKKEVRRFMLQERKRVDGRRFDEIRPISCEVGILPRTHGSALFTRGQTQSLATTTLGTSRDEQIIDALEGDVFKRFILHYNFPGFSVGEVKQLRSPGRREIGHGALAERSLEQMVPSKEDFPYTIRVVSDILESNGSSSMASVCAGSLSLMDAGVPLKRPVSGVAMGLIYDKENSVILTDIAGVEDHYGDMDFKVAGTSQGITALQLDLKVKEGISTSLLKKGLEQAKQGRLFILREMDKAIKEARSQLSAFAPRVTKLKINPEKIGGIIGPGGKMIRKITRETGAIIDVEDDGTVCVTSRDPRASQKAVDFIQGLTQEAEVGKVYNGKITRLMNFGAFCEILPGKEGLIHVSELADRFVDNVESLVKVGDEIQVKVIEIDVQGRINLSAKQAARPDELPVVSRRSEKRFDKSKDKDQARTR